MTPHTHEGAENPAALRSVFGANLRKLAADYPSVAGLCRDLGINRTQFNRYLSGESFPRPDVLHRICAFFDVDARILLEPVETVTRTRSGIFNDPVIEDFLTRSGASIPEEDFPSGFYRFSRGSFVEQELFAIGLVYVFRKGESTFVRGYEPPQAMSIQGMGTTARQREYRGVVLRQEQGVTILTSRRGATTCSFSFLSRLASYNNNYWEGYATRTTAESLTERRVARLVFEHLQDDFSAAREVAGQTGFVSHEELPPYHTRLLRVGQPFR